MTETNINNYGEAEKTLWETIKRHGGDQTGTYRQGTETRTVSVVPENAKPNAFRFDEQTFTTTSRIFKLGKAELDGLIPKTGDTLEFNGETFIIKKTGASPTCWQDIGNYGVMLRVFITQYRQ